MRDEREFTIIPSRFSIFSDSSRKFLLNAKIWGLERQANFHLPFISESGKIQLATRNHFEWALFGLLDVYTVKKLLSLT